MSYNLTPEQEALVAHWSGNSAMRFMLDGNAGACPAPLRRGNTRAYFLSLSERRRALLIAETLEEQSGARETQSRESQEAQEAQEAQPREPVALLSCAGHCGTWLPAASTWRPAVRRCKRCYSEARHRERQRKAERRARTARRAP